MKYRTLSLASARYRSRFCTADSTTQSANADGLDNADETYEVEQDEDLYRTPSGSEGMLPLNVVCQPIGLQLDNESCL